jgi:hypothetical protein
MFLTLMVLTDPLSAVTEAEFEPAVCRGDVRVGPGIQPFLPSNLRQALEHVHRSNTSRGAGQTHQKVQNDVFDPDGFDRPPQRRYRDGI